MDRDIMNSYAISYPLSLHTVGLASERVRIAYLTLLSIFFEKHFDGDPGTELRFRHFFYSAFHTLPNNLYCNDNILQQDVFKTRFKPFRFYSYRYQFLFDCIFLLAPECEEKAQQICAEIKKSTKPKYHAELDRLLSIMFSDEISIPDTYGISAESIQYWKDTQHYLKTECKKIVFTATMSAGKSTLVNAIIGHKISAVKKAACTSTVVNIMDAAPTTYPYFHIFQGNKVLVQQTAAQVRAFTQGLTNPCTILGCFNSILQNNKIVLVDTPGVDSSQNPRHKEITCKALSQEHYDLLIYVIPVEAFGSERDLVHLTYIKKNAKFKRIIFVVNMMDSCDYEEESNAEIIENVKEHLRSIGFSDPIVCPISAKAGGLIKAKLSCQQLSESEMRACSEFKRRYLQPEYNLSAFYSFKKNYETQTFCNNQHSEADWAEAYKATGLPSLESTILEQIEED